MTITYPEVQISGTAEEICAVLQCLMLNMAGVVTKPKNKP